ncbi:MAG: DUF72 domain-containing protein [Actinomycetota bacterium]
MLFIGTSGWQYKDWKGAFYPWEMAQDDWLGYYSSPFRTVEVNNTFYRLPPLETFERWAARVPDDFVVTVKMSRYLTHIKRLKDPQEPVERFLSRCRGLGPKLGPVLLQLPPNLQADPQLLLHTLELIPSQLRVAVEFRHASWFTEDTRQVLKQRGAAWCLADRGSRPKGPVWRSADWGFLRMHEGSAKPHPCYGDDALKSWACRIGDMWDPAADVFVYFNNDHKACAVRDAARFTVIAEAVGLVTE